MCWVNGKSAPERPPRRRGAWSIARRLTVLYTVSAFGLLSLGTGFLYWALSTNLRAEDDQFLVDILETISTILREHPGEAAPLRVEVELEGPARRYAQYFVRVIDDTGKVFMETPGINEAVPGRDRFPAPTVSMNDFQRVEKWRSPAGKPFLLAARRAGWGNSGQGRALIQIALDATLKEQTLARYRRWLALVLGAGILFSASAGLAIARRGLRPLGQITQAAQRVTATRLQERIGPADWPVELATLATEFDRMLARLEESFTRLSQFSADLAHELRTPVNNLMGAADVTLSRARTPEEYREVLESGLEEYGRLARMIDSLLFLARAENAETKLQKTPFDAVKEIQSVLEYYEPLSAEEDVEVAFAPPGPGAVPVMVNADVILFRRALSNLIANALNFTARGGRVSVRARPADGGAVEIEVADNGCGIGAEHLPKLFDRFYRVDPARARHRHGTGLGLAIVRSILDLHGGTVSVASQPGKGATFTLRFPAELPNAQSR